MENNLVEIDFKPNKPQKALLENFKRFNIFECHRGGGKTYLACMILVLAALSSKHKDAKYCFLSPTIEQGDRNTSTMVNQMVENIPGLKHQGAKNKITFPNGAELYFLGLRDSEKIRGSRWDGIVIDEFRSLKGDVAETWNSVIVPTIYRWAESDRTGWVLITSTPPQVKHYYTELYRMGLQSPETWNVLKFPVTETGVYSAEEIAEFQNTMTPTAFEIEYMCSHDIPLEGAYYSESLRYIRKNNQISFNVKYNPHKPVFVSVDSGKDGMCFWFMQHDRQTDRMDFIDFHLESNHTKKHVDFINMLRSKQYVYEYIYLPHDSVKTGASVITSMAEEYKKYFGRSVKVLKRANIQDGIQAVKNNFGNMYFNPAVCEQGLLALQEYAPKQTGDKTAYTSTPVHNWASHPADALRYMVQGIKEYPFNPSIDRNGYCSGNNKVTIEYEGF